MPPRTKTRTLVPLDLDEIVAIEKASYPSPWNRRDFKATMKQPYTNGLVFEIDHAVAAYFVYTFTGKTLRVLNLTVKKDWRRHDIGSTLLTRVLTHLKPTTASVELREHDTVGQLFFKHHGFRYVRTFPRLFVDTLEDGYLLSWEREPSPNFTNRVAQYLGKS